MKKNKKKFNLNEDIIMQIEMDSFMAYNDIVVTINDYLGELYGYDDLQSVKMAQLEYERDLAYIAIEQLQQKLNVGGKKINKF